MNADIVTIKPLYFELGSKNYEQAKNAVVCMARLLPNNGHLSSHFETILIELPTHAYFIVFFHSMRSNCKHFNSKFLWHQFVAYSIQPVSNLEQEVVWYRQTQTHLKGCSIHSKVYSVCVNILNF